MKKTITIRIDEENLAKVKALAKKDQRSIGCIIRMAVEKYLKGIKK